jgi:hypothetical protein
MFAVRAGRRHKPRPQIPDSEKTRTSQICFRTFTSVTDSAGRIITDAMSDPSDDPACQFADDDIDFSELQVTNVTQSLAAFSPSAEVPLITISTLPSERTVLHKSEVPEKFQCVFDDYPYFNVLQSKLLPDLLHADNSIAVCAPTGSGKTALF